MPVSRPRLRSVVLATLVAVLCAGTAPMTTTGTTTGTTAKATGFGRLNPPARVPLRGDGLDLTGYLSSPVSGRPVLLQAKTPTGWKPVATTQTTTRGAFTFPDVRLRTNTVLRVRSKSWQKGKAARMLPPIVSKPVPVRVAHTQSGTAIVLPGVAQRGPAPGAPTDSSQLVAQFTPAWPERQVALQQRTKQGWVTVAVAAQDPSGHVDFNLPDTTSTYRAVTKAMRGTKWKTPRVSTRAVAARGWDLLFEDTFSGASLDTSVWSDQLKDSQPGVEAMNRHCSRISPTTRHVSDGVLHLGISENPTKAGVPCEWTNKSTGTSGTHPHMWNSQVMSRGKFEFTYGIAAARMKVQQAKGMHSAFWLQPHDIPNGHPSKGTEIDVMEFFGEAPTGSSGICSFVHWYDNSWDHQKSGGCFPKTTPAMKPVGSDWWDEFHVFSVEWTPQAYIFRVDGREFHRETEYISHTPEHLLFSMLSADYEIAHLTPEEWAQTAQADWVRVWAP